MVGIIQNCRLFFAFSTLLVTSDIHIHLFLLQKKTPELAKTNVFAKANQFCSTKKIMEKMMKPRNR